jgi:hypothetical protein
MFLFQILNLTQFSYYQSSNKKSKPPKLSRAVPDGVLNTTESVNTEHSEGRVTKLRRNGNVTHSVNRH